MGLMDGSFQRILCWLWSGLQSVVGVVIVLFLLPIAIPILLLLWVWRCIAVLMVRAIHGQWAQPASGMEAVFALDSARARAVISAVAVLKGRLSVSTIRTFLSERIMEAKDEKGNFLHPKFRQLVEVRCGVVMWMWEQNFTVVRHVKQLRTDCKPRLLQDEDDLVWELSAHTNDPFVRGQARWEVLVAPLRRYGKYVDREEDEWNHTAVILRVHHALGDGRSLVGLIVSALVDSPLLEPRPSSPVCGQPCNGCTTRIIRMLWSMTHLPWVMIRVLLNRDDASVIHGPRLGGVKHLAWSSPLSLAALKRGRALAGVSVNDLFYAGLAAALYKHFCFESSNVPPRVITALPIDVRAPGSPLSLANHISLCTVPLPTNKMTPKERLMIVHQRMSILKSSPDVMANYVSLNLIANLLPSPIARRVLGTHGVTMVTSNMPGPAEQISLFGAPVDDIMFWIPNKSRTGLGVSMLSYCGSVRIGLNVDSALMPQRDLAQQLLDNLVTEVESILMALSPTEQRIEANYEIVHDNKSDNSDLTDVVVTHSTDEYDDQHGATYSDIHSSSDVIKKSNDLDTTYESDDYIAFESDQLLKPDFNTTRLEIQSFLTSGNNKGTFCENKLMMTRSNKSETDVNILAAKFEVDI